MTGARDTMLAEIRRALGRESSGPAATAVASRLAAHPVGPVPARARGTRVELLDRFALMVEASAASIVKIASPAEVPRAVAAFLVRHNLPAELRLAPDPALTSLPWAGTPTLSISSGPARPDDVVALTPAFAGVAETGTLVMVSDPATPTLLNFLPDTHIVLLRSHQVVGGFEEVLARLRHRYGEGTLPRTVDLITGPSRSGDIEQILQMGAHGPRRLHVLLLDDEAPQA